MQGLWIIASFLVLTTRGCIGPIGPPATAPTTPPVTSSCARYGPSSRSPTKVWRLTPGDIGILGVIGKVIFLKLESNYSIQGTLTQQLLGQGPPICLE